MPEAQAVNALLPISCHAPNRARIDPVLCCRSLMESKRAMIHFYLQKVADEFLKVLFALPSLFQDPSHNKPILCTRALKECTYLSPGRSLTLAVISAASGTSFSTNSRGPQNDLFCPRKVFLAKNKKK